MMFDSDGRPLMDEAARRVDRFASRAGGGGGNSFLACVLRANRLRVRIRIRIERADGEHMVAQKNHVRRRKSAFAAFARIALRNFEMAGIA